VSGSVQITNLLDRTRIQLLPHKGLKSNTEASLGSYSLAAAVGLSPSAAEIIFGLTSWLDLPADI